MRTCKVYSVASVLLPLGLSCSREDKDLFAVLLKPCMDISMWKGYDHSKNAAYYMAQARFSSWSRHKGHLQQVPSE